MKRNQHKDHIAATLRRIAASYADTIRRLEQQFENLTVLARELELEEPNWDISSHSKDRDALSDARPTADRETLSAVYRGKRCFLGNTHLFRFFETIAARPNRYFSHAELLDEVWGTTRAESTIRNVAKRLRDRLTAAGLSDLAEAIDGRTRGFYVFLFNAKKVAGQTEIKR